MKSIIMLLFLLNASVSFSQMRPIDKVYIVEGVVADRESHKVIPNAILYSDSLKIMTTSDKNGYFKIVVPIELITKQKIIWIDIVKEGYKRNGSGFDYNPSSFVSTKMDDFAKGVWNSDVKIYWMAKNESGQSSTVSAIVRAKEGEYDAEIIKRSFDIIVASKKVQ